MLDLLIHGIEPVVIHVLIGIQRLPHERVIALFVDATIDLPAVEETELETRRFTQEWRRSRKAVFQGDRAGRGYSFIAHHHVRRPQVHVVDPAAIE